MPVYVDPLMDFGWIRRGIPTRNCHLFTDATDLAELHALAAQIGMPRVSFQPHPKAPHYDLDPPMRDRALAAGAIAVDRRSAVRLWQGRLGRIKREASGPRHSLERSTAQDAARPSDAVSPTRSADPPPAKEQP